MLAPGIRSQSNPKITVATLHVLARNADQAASVWIVSALNSGRDAGSTHLLRPANMTVVEVTAAADI